MQNQYVVQRLAGIQDILNSVHKASAGLSPNTKGKERESFIDEFLKNVLPNTYRFGTGDATDANGNISGQLDVVVEYPIAPTLPSVSGSSHPTRLYLAESVAAVIEVKSNVMNQWNEALGTAIKLSKLQRTFGSTISFGPRPNANIPLFVVGYTGWSSLASLEAKLHSHKEVEGILVIDQGIFMSRNGPIKATGPLALWGLITALSQYTSHLMSAQVNLSAYVS